MSLISGHSQAESAYEPTLWARTLHSTPHVNITLHAVDPRFNPESDLYLESLGILASIPAAWLITTLVVLLIYLCTRCCDTKSTKKRKSRPIRCCLSLFALLTCTALAVGFLGNHLVHVGMEEFQRATVNINNIVKRSQELAKRYNNVFMNEIDSNLNRLYDGPFQRDIRDNRNAHFEIMDNSDIIFHNITEGLESMDKLRSVIEKPNGDPMTFQYLPFWAHAIEKYRWPAIMGVLGLFGLFCLLLLVGAVVHSRCVLIIFSVCGLFAIITLWLLASVYTLMAVGLGDLCYNPTPWVQHSLRHTFDEEVAFYYLRCPPGRAKPFENSISKSRRVIADIDHRVKLIATAARKYYSPVELSPQLDDLERHTAETVQLMSDLDMALRCEPIYRSYNTALVALCDSGLLGLILMLISAAASGLLFTILVWCNSHTWIYFKYKGRYVKVDDQDPYMPLSTIERPRLPPTMTSANTTSTMPMTNVYAAHHRRTLHTPPPVQTPAFQSALNGNTNTNSRTMGSILSNRGQQQQLNPGYGHTAHMPNTLAHQQHLYNPGDRASASNMLGTLGRNGMMQNTSHQRGYQGLDNLPATMTLGRRGHYASGNMKQSKGLESEVPLLGPNMGQYATLSKQCKTLESSDFY